jgi:signal transduction histidine kinase
MTSTALNTSSWQPPTRALANTLLRTLAVALAVFVLSYASIRFTRETNSVATFWPANALFLAVLLRGARDVAILALTVVGVSVALFLSNAACGNGLALSLALTVANVAEVLTAYWLLNRFGYATPDVSRTRNLTFLLLFAAGTAPIISACIGAAAVAVAFQQSWLHLWLTWYAADALGMAIVAPLALSISVEQWRRLKEQRRIGEAAAVVVLVVLIASVAGYYRLFIFITAPLVLFATFRFGVLGSATATLVIAVIASVLIVTGTGPALLAQSGMPERIFILQIFLAVTVFWSLPVATALAERDRYAAQLSQAKARAEAVSETKSQAVIHLQRRLWKAEEDERLRLAHELHDRSGQSLAVAMLDLKQIERIVPPDALDCVRHLRAQLDEMGRTLHQIAWELRPPSIDELGLAKALGDYVSAWGEKFGIVAELHCSDPELDQRPDEMRIALYRITQEALTNIAKHASGANAVSVSIGRSGDFLRLTIEDNGCGFDTRSTHVSKGPGLGLAGMRERLSFVDGELDVESKIGTGTTLFARIPVNGGAVS